MRIAAVEAIHLRLPVVDEIADGTQDLLVVRVRSDEGLVGYGEVASAPTVARAVIEAPRSAVMRHGLAVALKDADPLQPEACWDLMFEATRWYGRSGVVIHAISGVDMALWDLKAKAERKSLAALWGLRRERVRAYASVLFPEDPAEAAAMVASAREQGFTAIKFGFGSFGFDREHDRALMDAIRAAAGPSMDVMVDVGRRWTHDDAVERSTELFERYGVLWVEEPLNEDDLEGYRRLAAAAPGRIAAGESDATLRPYRELLAAGVTVVQADVGRAGGFTVCRQISELAAEANAWCVPHCFGTGINLAASMQWMAAAPEAFFCEFPIRPSPLLASLTRHGPRQVDGWVTLPEGGDGLGVEVDESVLDRFRC